MFRQVIWVPTKITTLAKRVKIRSLEMFPRSYKNQKMLKRFRVKSSQKTLNFITEKNMMHKFINKIGQISMSRIFNTENRS